MRSFVYGEELTLNLMNLIFFNLSFHHQEEVAYRLKENQLNLPNTVQDRWDNPLIANDETSGRICVATLHLNDSGTSMSNKK